VTSGQSDYVESQTTAQSSGHINCYIRHAGFRISVEMPFIGASADGYVTRDCHGKGVVKVKCPYTDRNSVLSELLLIPTMQCEKNHKYNIQMQLEMYVSNVSYCDLVVWQTSSILIVPVERDEELIASVLARLQDVWVRHIDKTHRETS